MEKLLSVKELCEYLDIAKSTLYEHIKKGLPYYQVGKVKRFDVKEVLKYFNERNE